MVKSSILLEQGIVKIAKFEPSINAILLLLEDTEKDIFYLQTRRLYPDEHIGSIIDTVTLRLTPSQANSREIKIKQVLGYFYKNKYSVKHSFYVIYFPDHYAGHSASTFHYDLVYICEKDIEIHDITGLKNNKQYRDVLLYPELRKYGLVYAQPSGGVENQTELYDVKVDTFYFEDNLIPEKGPTETLTSFVTGSKKYGIFAGRYRSELSSSLNYKHTQNLIVHYQLSLQNSIEVTLIGSD